MENEKRMKIEYKGQHLTSGTVVKLLALVGSRIERVVLDFLLFDVKSIMVELWSVARGQRLIRL